jgi:CDP-3, 6-dideoxy-D-glycero-L-glycero-4-hexulose-4-reductase
VPALFDAARTGNRLDMTDGHQLVDLVHVDDAVGALLTVAAFTPEAPGTTFAAGGGTPVTLRALVAAVGRATGREIDVAWGARPGRPREMRSPWTTSPPPPGWSPCIPLDEGLGALAETLGAGPRS